MDRLLHFAERYPLDVCAHLSSLVAVIFGMITFRLHRPAHRYVWLLFVFFFVKDSYSLWYIYQKSTNLFIQNLETLFETALVGLIYYSCFSNRNSRRIILGAGILTTGVILLTYSPDQLSLPSLLLFRVYSIVISLAYFNRILADLRIRNILKHPLFWFTAGLLIFVLGTFFTSLFSEFIFDPKTVSDETFDFYWNINNVLFVFFSLSGAAGLWCVRYDRHNVL